MVQRVVGPQLKRLAVPGDLAPCLGALTSLEHVEVEMHNGHTLDVQPLQLLPSLRSLHVTNEWDHGGEITGLATLTQLTELWLDECSPTDFQLPPYLTSLALSSPFADLCSEGIILDTPPLPEFLRLCVTPLISLKLSLGRFHCDPYQLDGVPCLSRLQHLHLHLQFPFCSAEVWDPCFQELQTLTLELPNDQGCQPAATCTGSACSSSPSSAVHSRIMLCWTCGRFKASQRSVSTSALPTRRAT